MNMQSITMLLIIISKMNNFLCKIGINPVANCELPTKENFPFIGEDTLFYSRQALSGYPRYIPWRNNIKRGGCCSWSPHNIQASVPAVLPAPVLLLPVQVQAVWLPPVWEGVHAGEPPQVGVQGVQGGRDQG